MSDQEQKYGVKDGLVSTTKHMIAQHRIIHPIRCFSATVDGEPRQSDSHTNVQFLEHP